MRKTLLSSATAFAVSAALLSVIQAPHDAWFLAPVAMVPFALACRPEVRAQTPALLAWLVGTAYWLANIYWIAPITIPGWLAMGVYLAVLWPLLAMAIRWAKKWNVPMALALPILVVGAERLQGFPLGGFYWRLLGHSQYANLTLIQISDLFGAAGVSFLVAAINGVVVDWIQWWISTRSRVCIAHQLDNVAKEKVCSAHPTRVISTVATVLAVAATVGYGRWRIAQAAATVQDGPLVAALQSNVPQSVKRSFSVSDQLFGNLMAKSEAAAQAGAELIVWPETMVQAFLQPELWPYFSPPPEEDMAFHKALSNHAKDTTYLLVGAYGGEIMTDPQGELFLGQYNSAYLYRPDGSRDPQRYDKIHLVLFGEYIPFRRSFNWLYQQLKRFAPAEYNYDYSLEHGTHYTIYEMSAPIPARDPNGPRQTSESIYHFGTIICYEDAIPYVARNFALDETGGKRVDWLVNISNDGWFVRFLDDPPRVIPSTELPQHAAICVFRAVENRLPILRSVNTGISCLIDSSGRIHNQPIASSDGFPDEPMQRTGISGWFLDRMPIDSRVTFFSRHGQWLDTGCAVAFVAVLVLPAGVGLARRRAQKRAKRSA